MSPHAFPASSLTRLPLLFPLLLVAACGQITGTAAPRLNAAGEALRGTYSLSEKNLPEVRLRAYATVNNSRAAAGLAPLQPAPALERAATAHSDSMSAQKRAWAFGENGETPLSRLAEAGYGGRLIGQVVSETYESEVRTIATWMGHPAQKAILLDPAATHLGLGVHQDPNHKLWWTLILAQ